MTIVKSHFRKKRKGGVSVIKSHKRTTVRSHFVSRVIGNPFSESEKKRKRFYSNLKTGALLGLGYSHGKGKLIPTINNTVIPSVKKYGQYGINILADGIKAQKQKAHR
ncbi:hypothetical protein [Flammeovirga agarivorans]|uniref:Uncharacterized protein n=1 Tax=Flammeovirga agarivorans TaxID=2726742 RepID=A0A7X8XZ62_9BACT|nr:hypothetical protein [Flammeovirga agarivorans]NLR94876.1 hypothetical protein [Flammeovirga agarivorans]